MLELLALLLLVALFLLIGVVLVAYRFYRKAVVYDEVFQFLADDIEVNLSQFHKMKRSDLTGNEPEIETAHRNMMVMSKRLDEILSRMQAATGLQLRPPASPPRPKVV